MLNLLRRAGIEIEGKEVAAMLWLRRRREECACRGRRCGKKSLCGILCIVAGILVLVCFAPNWFIAVVVSFLLMAVGALLLGFR